MKSDNDQLNEKERSHFEDIEKIETCKHPEHNPPSHLYIPQGKRYVHICPSCGNREVIAPPQISFHLGEIGTDLIQAYNHSVDKFKKQIESKVPIRKECPNSQCYCSGDCQTIIGWRDKTREEINQERINRPPML